MWGLGLAWHWVFLSWPRTPDTVKQIVQSLPGHLNLCQSSQRWALLELWDGQWRCMGYALLINSPAWKCLLGFPWVPSAGTALQECISIFTGTAVDCWVVFLAVREDRCHRGCHHMRNPAFCWYNWHPGTVLFVSSTGIFKSRHSSCRQSWNSLTKMSVKTKENGAKPLREEQFNWK